MAVKRIKRPITFAIGLVLIFIALFDFLDTLNFENIFTETNIIMILIGLVFVLFAFAKSD